MASSSIWLGTSSSDRQPNIRWPMIVASLYAMLRKGAAASLFPFLTLFLSQLGLSLGQIGLVFGARALVWTAASLVLSHEVGRRCSRRFPRSLLCFSVLISIAMAAILSLAPFAIEAASDNVPNRTRSWCARPAGYWEADVSGDWMNNVRVTLKSSAYPLLTPTQISVSSALPLIGKPSSSRHKDGMKVAPSSAATKTTDEEKSDGKKVSTLMSPLISTADPSNSLIQVGGTGGNENATESDNRSKIRKRRKRRKKRWRMFSQVLNSNKADERGRWQGLHLYVFLAVLGVLLIGQTLATPLDTAADNMLHEYLQMQDATERLHEPRPWGFLGAAVASVISGIMADYGCLSFGPALLFHLYNYIGFHLIIILPILFYPLAKDPQQSGIVGLSFGGQFFKSNRVLAWDKWAIAMMVSLAVSGGVTAVVETLLAWHIVSLGGSETAVGVAIAAGSLGEMSAPLLLRISSLCLSHRHPSAPIRVALSLLLQGSALLASSLLPWPWTLPLALLVYGVSVALARRAVEPQVETYTSAPSRELPASMFLEMVSKGMGPAVSASLVGFLASSPSNVPIAFQLFAGILIAAGVSIIAATLLCPPISQNLNYSRLLADDSDNLDSEEELKDWLVQALRHSKE
uniref:Major facilitator superfamily associated domain-containing protein n=1 Tax=Eptatretus burgeri TaxID=7764 RepID=A0A8C4X0V4_EPTBU